MNLIRTALEIAVEVVLCVLLTLLMLALMGKAERAHDDGMYDQIRRPVTK